MFRVWDISTDTSGFQGFRALIGFRIHGFVAKGFRAGFG